MTSTTTTPRRPFDAANSLLFSALLGLTCTTASAQAEAVSKVQSQIKSLTTDLSMSATPAAVHVGLSAESVVLPRTRREFEAAAKTLLSDGSKPAGSMELLPYFVFRGGELDFATYEGNGWLRALTRTSVGVAAGKRKVGDAKAEISANGLSISTVIADLADPAHHLSLQTCLNQAQALAAAGAKPAPGETVAPIPAGSATSGFSDADKLTPTKDATEAYKSCMTEFKARTWNRSRVGFGLAHGSGRESAGAKRKIKYGSSLWLTAQYGFEDFKVLRKAFFGEVFVDCTNGRDDRGTCIPRQRHRLEDRAMISFHARRTTGATDLDLTQAGALPTLRSSLVGTRFTYGTDKLHFFVEASRQASRQSVIGSTRTNLYAFGGSRQLGDNFWINFVTGRRKDIASGKPDNIVQVDLSWGLSDEPTVAGPPAPVRSKP